MGSRTTANIELKKVDVSNLAKEIESYGSMLVFEYVGLDASEIFSMKRKLRSYDSKMLVCTNNVINRAIQSLSIKEKSTLTGPNAILLTRNNIKPIKEMAALSKDRESIKIKLVYFEGELMENKSLQMLSSLDSKEVLLATFSQRLMTPLYKFLYLLQTIRDKKL